MSDIKRETLKIGSFEIPMIVDDRMPPNQFMFLTPKQVEKYLEHRAVMERLNNYTVEFFKHSALPSRK